MRTILLFVFILAVFLLSGCGESESLELKLPSQKQGTESTLPNYGKAPEFSVTDLNGNSVKRSDYDGKVLFINIWATWCPYCVQEIPSMQKLYSIFKDKGFEILAVSVDHDKSSIYNFLEKYKLTFPVLTDPEAKVAQAYYGSKRAGIPQTYIVDKKGNIRNKTIGAKDWANPESIKMIESLLAE